MWKRYLVEIGTGADLHGMDVMEAASRAVRDAVFHTYGGGETTVQMMYSEEYGYIEDGDAAGFIKPYAGGRYSFAALLPNEGVDIYDYIRTLSGGKLRALLGNAITRSTAQVVTGPLGSLSPTPPVFLPSTWLDLPCRPVWFLPRLRLPWP